MSVANPAADPTVPLPKRQLGTTGLEISLLATGAAPVGDLYEIMPESTAIETLVTAVRAGVNLIDTSPLYGHGLSELRVGAALRHVPDAKVFLSTKVGRVTDPFHLPTDRQVFCGGLPHSVGYDYTFDGVMRSVEQSLLRLGTDRIDLALVHDLDQWGHGDDLEAAYATAMNGAIVALHRLRDEGVITAFGAGLNEAGTAERFILDCAPDAILLAGRYSLLEQPALESFLPTAAARGTGVLLGGVFNSGILATGAVSGARYNYGEAPDAILSRVREIEAVCARHETPLRRAALQFALAHPAVTSLVLGAARSDEIHTQIDDIQQHIPGDLWSELKSLGLLPDHAPTPADSPHD